MARPVRPAAGHSPKLRADRPSAIGDTLPEGAGGIPGNPRKRLCRVAPAPSAQPTERQRVLTKLRLVTFRITCDPSLPPTARPAQRAADGERLRYGASVAPGADVAQWDVPH